jgi:ribosomal protein S12 methylthiotransferase
MDLIFIRNLVRELLKIENFEWIRLHYLYPANFPVELISLIRDNPRICRYIDIPIQHISDRMLGLMRRSHNSKETKLILNKLRKEIPGAVIRTTLIAGHPGETEEDYLELKDYISEFRFDRMGVFAYSHEEDTYSYNEYKDEISTELKESRVADLMDIQQSISSELNETLVGKIMKVIIDRKEGEFFVGRTEFDSPEVDQEVLVPIENDLITGNFYYILITKSTDFDLYGEPANPL